MMDKKIVSLLDCNLRVIIPDFGAFIIRQREPRIVVFNELLKNNDGLLIDHIMKTESVEQEVARQLLSDYNNQAIRTLELGKALIIEGIGSLQKNKEGKVIFTQENEIITLDEPEKVQEMSKSPYNVPEEAAAGLKKLSFFTTEVIRWIIIIIAINLGIIIFFVFKKDIRNFFGKGKEPAVISESVLDQLADSVISAANDTTVMYDEELTEPALEKEDGPVQANVRYFIVAGCFRDELNADQLVNSLKEKGYKAEKFGKIGDLFAVSFASFDEKELAVKELERIRTEFSPDAWMTHF